MGAIIWVGAAVGVMSMPEVVRITPSPPQVVSVMKPCPLQVGMTIREVEKSLGESGWIYGNTWGTKYTVFYKHYIAEYSGADQVIRFCKEGESLRSR